MKKDIIYRALLSAAAFVCLTSPALAFSGCGARAASGPAASNTASESSESSGSANVRDNYEETLKKLERLQGVIDEYYMPTDEMVGAEEMQEGIFKGFVDSLDDPYTVYYTKEEYGEVMESVEGRYSGIGILASQNPDTGAVSVVRTFDGSPAQKEGMEKEDVIIKVDGKDVSGEDLMTVVHWIKGDQGTEVEVEVYRSSDKKNHTFKLQRAEIEVPMVTYEMLEGGIGYISIFEFEQPTLKQFENALDALYAEGMKALVLDLRDNPGGLVDSATDILERILPKEKLLVYTVDKKEKKHEIHSKDDEKIDIPMAVLINGMSASASEIVSGCLQDYETATIVGTTSFGKGVVQYILPLGDGSALKLTSAYYYTPKGRNIHEKGIEPDVVVDAVGEDETKDNDSVNAGDQEPEDLQLKKAEEILREKMDSSSE